MAKAGFKIIDAEPHFLEPHDLWERNLPEPWRSKTAVKSLDKGKTGEGGAEVSVAGKETPRPSGPRLVRERAFRRVADQPLLAKVTADPSPENFIEGFDVEGIDVGVMMPTVGMGIVRFDGLDPNHSLALCRVYNDFAADFVKNHPDRMKFWAWLPPHDASLAAEEARRCVEELGAAGVAMTGGAVDGNLLCDDFFDPLWAQLNDLGVAFGLHGPPPSLYLKDNIAHRYNGHPRTQLVGQVIGNPFHAQTELAELILGGVLNAIVLADSFGWIGGASMASYTSTLRTNVRNRHGIIGENSCADFYTHCFCTPCAAAQEHYEVKTHLPAPDPYGGAPTIYAKPHHQSMHAPQQPPNAP